MSTTTANENENPPKGGSYNGEIMAASIVFVFVVLAFFIFLHVYFRSRARRAASASGRHPLIFVSGDVAGGAARRGLDATVLASLPVSLYRSEDFKACGGLECSVCLSNLIDGDKARILPGCKHGFHLDCIDMWLHSHSTCPLCRGPVSLTESSAVIDIERPSEPAASTIVAGAQEQVPEADPGPSSSSSRKPEGVALVIEIPRRPAPVLAFSSPTAGDGQGKSPILQTPTSTRRRSLRRILSREKKAPGPFCSRRNFVDDIEHATDSNAPARATAASP
ncbi:RING-H2 finger protein ATL2-like [Wolffia australiana]